MSQPARAIPYTLDGEQFIARGPGPAPEIVARSVARRINGDAVTLWPGNARGEYRAQWFDDAQDVFCEGVVHILDEVALAAL